MYDDVQNLEFICNFQQQQKKIDSKQDRSKAAVLPYSCVRDLEPGNINILLNFGQDVGQER